MNLSYEQVLVVFNVLVNISLLDNSASYIRQIFLKTLLKNGSVLYIINNYASMCLSVFNNDTALPISVNTPRTPN